MNERATLPRFVFIVLFVVLLLFAVNNFTISALQSFVEFISGDLASLGISFAIFTFFAMLFRLVSGRLLGKVNDAFVLILGAVLILFAMCGYYLSISTTQVYFMRALHGVGFAFFNVAYYTMLVKTAPTLRTGEVIGYANSMNFVTMIFFPFIGSDIVSDMTGTSFELMFFIAIVGSVFVVISGVALWRSTHGTENQFEHYSNKSQVIERNALMPTLAIIFVAFDIGVVVSYSPSLAPLHGVTNPGLYLAFLAVSQLISAMIGGPLSDRHGYKQISFLGVLLSTVGLVIGSFGFDIVTYALSAIILGAGISFASIGFFSLAAISVPTERKANAMATVTAGWDGGVMIGSLLIGALIGVGLQLDFLLLLSGAITLICLVLYKRF
ncbi:MAG: MFS transporter [Candidatus Thorarchaeota archaeon]